MVVHWSYIVLIVLVTRSHVTAENHVKRNNDMEEEEKIVSR